MYQHVCVCVFKLMWCSELKYFHTSPAALLESEASQFT